RRVNAQPKISKWNAGGSFIPPAPIAAPAPRRSASNRRVPTASEVKKLVPKAPKGSTNRKNLDLPEDDTPMQLVEAEEGYWDEVGQWVEFVPSQEKRKGRVKSTFKDPDEESSEEQDQLEPMGMGPWMGRLKKV